MTELSDVGITVGLVAIATTLAKTIESLVKRKKNGGSPTTKLNGELSRLNEVLTHLDVTVDAQTLIQSQTSERLIDICLSQEKLSSNQTLVAERLGSMGVAVSGLPGEIRRDISGAADRVISAIGANKP